MGISLESLLAVKLADKTHTYTEKDVILYALGIGLGSDPTDEDQLRFVYEENLIPLPTLPVVLGATRIRDLDLGINYLKTVHGEQAIVLHKLPPISGTVITRSRINGVLDKGVDKGAVILLRRDVSDQATGDLIATIDMTLFARGDGGLGSSMAAPPASRAIPDRPADFTCDMPTLPQAALIYRLSGDMNPLHATPAVARQAGFDRPILHGLATYGVVAYAVVKTLCGNDPARLGSLSGRFSAPVFPGEIISVQMWREKDGVCIQATVAERNVVVLNNGFAEIR
ncbi:MAG: MaoC/PaaZ C-terminal domain-containing protein [Pseudomonadota bacterium]